MACVVLLPPKMQGARHRFFAVVIGSCLSAAGQSPNQPAPPPEESGWHNYFAGLVSPIAVVGSAAGAGIGQWRNSPREWGLGAAGYGTRFASSFAEHVVYQSILSGTASVLREDTRYRVSGESRFKVRLKYALVSTFLARSRDGSRHVSLSKISAFTGAAFLSRAWQPPSTGPPHNAAVNLGASVAVGAGVNVAREFLPQRLQKWLGR